MHGRFQQRTQKHQKTIASPVHRCHEAFAESDQNNPSAQVFSLIGGCWWQWKAVLIEVVRVHPKNGLQANLAGQELR